MAFAGWIKDTKMLVENQYFWLSLFACLAGAALLIAALIIAIKNQNSNSNYMKSMADYQEERAKQDPGALGGSKA